MRKPFCLLMAVLLAAPAIAQQDSTVLLNDVEVKAAQITKRADGMIYIPSEAQKKASANGYSLLNKLSMPMIRTDEAMHSLSSVDNKVVELRMNGAITTKADLQALDPKLVRSVEFINNPGVRYGDGVGYVINIRTRRDNEGYTIGADLSNALTYRQGDDMVYARWNHGKSELGLTYGFGYSDSRKNRRREEADYLLNDGSHHNILREDSARRDRSFSNNIQLKYSLADSSAYVFQATLSTDFQHSPGDWRQQIFTETGMARTTTEKLLRDKSFSPVIDLYFYHAIGKSQSLTANVTATSIATDESNSNNEGSTYAYNVDGNTWSMATETIYENQLKPFTLSFGINHKWKYTRNIYSGDVESTNSLHNSTLYLFSQLKGNLLMLNELPIISYTLGLGVSNARYRQGNASFNHWLFRPKATLTYQPSQPWSLTYDFEVSQHISQIAMTSNTRIRTNSMEWTVGNPNIKPNSVIVHALKLAYTKPRLYAELYTEWRQNKDCNLASYERTTDNQFLYTQKNQPHCNMLYAEGYASWTIMPDKLKATANASIFRFFNKGDNYSHTLTTYNASCTLQAYLGSWTLTGAIDSGWKFMEGETWNHQGNGNTLQCSYRTGNCLLTLTCRHPFEAHPRLNHARLVNRYIRKDMSVSSADSGNAIFIGVSWKLNRGRSYKTIGRTMKNKDTQTGIM